ncbi:MAG: hypothetical protein JWL83_4224 [Actinomycetia bacterium]|nr:hypothetical protein [Actinomycetes bacterium]
MLVFGVSGFLLLSMGGAIVAAPLTVPALVIVRHRHPSATFRVVAAILAAATIAEVAWALTYLALGETAPWIWLIPLVAGIATLAATARSRRQVRWA